jgi:predicted alpha/beta superfamily hydrolase/tetratricopeptide (TPR) repeat protein
MIKLFLKLTLITFIFSSCQTNNKIDSKKESRTIDIATKHVINSTHLNEKRDILISLPDGYEKTNATYPILVLTDGKQNIKHAIGSIELLTRTGSIPPIILVGIVSTNRTRDFSPSASKTSPGSGNGPNYLNFIEHEVIPFVEQNYRAHNFKVLEGHSLGGVFTAYALMEKPELFDAHLIMSPSFWWNNEEFIKKSGEFFRKNPSLSKAIYFSIGKDESSSKWGMRKELSNFVDSLKVNKPKNTRFKHQEFENEGHMSSPLLGTYYGLKYIFSDLIFTDEQAENYTDALFLAHEEKMMTKYGEQAKQSAEIYVQLAGFLSGQKKYKSAITVLTRGVEAYDYDIFLKYNLAKAYENDKNIPRAIETYKAAIATSIKHKFTYEERLQKEIDKLEEESIFNIGLSIVFKKDSDQLNESDQLLVKKILTDSESKIRKLLPTLPKDIKVVVSITSDNINQLNGINGRTERNNTALVFIEISKTFPGGITAAIKNGLEIIVYHEFHHLSRGWAIRDNQFRQGIDVAAINEGLAIVFSEIYTGKKLEANAFTSKTAKWVKEIIDLPKNANYGKWMSKHTDGRTAIGYRVGNYIVTNALNKSTINILELSKLTPEEIYTLAGYKIK